MLVMTRIPVRTGRQFLIVFYSLGQLCRILFICKCLLTYRRFCTSPLQSDDAFNPERLYDLMAVVVHCGSGPNRGHYISVVKSHGYWLLFDDDAVEVNFLLNNLLS